MWSQGASWDELWAVAYRFLEMGLVAGKSDAVAMVLKGILPGFAPGFGFGLHGKVFLVLAWAAGFANATYRSLPKVQGKPRRQARSFCLLEALFTIQG